MQNEISKYKNFYEQVKINFLNKDKFFHAYIIETNENENYENAIIELVKLIFSRNFSDINDFEYKRICNLIDNESFVDFIEVFPNNQIIKKEQLIDVKYKFKNKSLGNMQVYVVFDADKMNKEASNTILKFLEEPSDGVIAILVTKNKYMLLDTIISRCQILSMDNIDENLYDSILVHFFELFNSSKNAFLNYNKIIEELFVDKKQTIKILDLLEKKYYNYISSFNDSINFVEEDENLNGLTLDQLLKFVELIRKEKEKLKYNLNFKLWLDNFIIRYMEVKENV